MRNLIFVAFVAALVAGCQTQPTQPPAPSGESSSTSSTATTPGGGASTAGTSQSNVGGSATSSSASSANMLRDPNSPLSKRSIYFDFDSFVVKDEYRPLVEAHARYLQSTPNARMTIQGNADERGSREYNIALGQKRAEATKRMMEVLGARDQQIETVSFGKEKPKALGHDESAWAQNRRDDLVYAGE